MIDFVGTDSHNLNYKSPEAPRTNMKIILIGAVVCLIFFVMGNYLYYNLAVKAYTLEFLYNNSCCITDMNTNVIRLNNNMIDGINTICSVQNRNSGNNAGSNSSKS